MKHELELNMCFMSLKKYSYPQEYFVKKKPEVKGHEKRKKQTVTGNESDTIFDLFFHHAISSRS